MCSSSKSISFDLLREINGSNGIYLKEPFDFVLKKILNGDIEEKKKTYELKQIIAVRWHSDWKEFGGCMDNFFVVVNDCKYFETM